MGHPRTVEGKRRGFAFLGKQVGKIAQRPKVDRLKRALEQHYLSDEEGGLMLKAVTDVWRVTEETRLTPDVQSSRCLRCTRHKMQLVVMAAVLALAGAGLGCSFGCHPTNISIPVESCGSIEFVYTTICAGQCYHEDPVYIGPDDWPEQRICNGDWSYEVKHIRGCPVGVTYPVARNCECTSCNAGSTYCGRFPGDIPSCLSF